LTKRDLYHVIEPFVVDHPLRFPIISYFSMFSQLEMGELRSKQVLVGFSWPDFPETAKTLVDPDVLPSYT
tara:strand:- start:3 stop:212 length:210 start_codon:yes stop_codon:yes gene_type:complete